MKKPSIFFSLSLLFFCGTFYSQTSKQVEEVIPGIQDSHKREILAEMENDMGQQVPAKPHTSMIFIQQVGNSNHSRALVTASQTNLLLQQTGNHNFMQLKANVKTIEGKVIQQGNHNYSFDFLNDPSLDVPMHVEQLGNNLHFERHGTNSIGSQLKIEMSGNSRSVVVRNFSGM